MNRFLENMAVCLLFFLFGVSEGHAQCMNDDSIRHVISMIKNEQCDDNAKLEKLIKLRVSYLSCHPKISAVYAEIMHRIGDCYAKSGNLEQGIAYTTAAAEVNEQTGNPVHFLCHSYYNLGVFYLQLNMVHQCSDYFNHCISASRAFPEKYFITGMAYAQLAYLFFKEGDYQQARDMASKGMPFSIIARDTVTLGSLWVQKAQAEIELGDFSYARESINKALSLLHEKNSVQLASAYAIYANFLSVTSQYPASLIYYQKAIALNKQLADTALWVNNLNDLGYVYYNDLKQEDNARKCYYEGLRLTIKNKDNYQLAGLYENIGATYWGQADFKRALQFYQKGLNTLPINFSDQSVFSNPDIKTLNQIANDYYVSTLFADKGESLLALYKQTADKSLLKAALQTFLLASQSVDLMRWKQRGELSKLIWRSQTKQMYENAIAVCYLLNDTENGFYFFERSRAVLLYDQLNSSRGTDLNMFKKPGRGLQSTMDSINRQLISTNNGPDADRIKAKWTAVHEEWEDQQNEIGAKPYEGDDKPGKTPEYKAVQQQLFGNKQTLVEYFNKDSIVYALLITPARSQLFYIPYAAYRNDCSEFLKYCSNAALLNKHYDRYVKLAATLYQKLFAPLHITYERVIISPGDNFIPFDALLESPGSDSSFLVKKYAFSYVYSMQVLLMQHATVTGGQPLFLGIAPEKFATATHLPPLIGSVASLQHIEKEFRYTSLLKREDAKKDQVLSRMPQAQIVQLYTHATADSTTRDPVLYLADSMVSMHTIERLDCHNTSMVVLSACNTGLGYNAVGEGLFSLARGFRLAGIPSTVTNLWQADDQATYTLTESFYKYLLLGLPKDESLRKAKLDFLKNNPSHMLPYYWAPAIVLGDSAPLSSGLSAHRLEPVRLLLVVTVLVLLGCFFLFSRRKNKNTIKS